MTRVCAFYSKGRRYQDVLRWVRAHYGEASIVAMVPSTYLLPPEERDAADEVVTTERARYSGRSAMAFVRLVRQIRAQRYEVFVITFDSPRLRILAALSGAKRLAYCSMDRQVVPIKATVPGTVLRTIAQNLWGRLVYATVWCAVRVAKVR